MSRGVFVVKAVLFMALLVVASSCNLGGLKSIGIPTVTLSTGDSSLTQDDSGNWQVDFEVRAHTLPGSPAGSISKFELSSGDQIGAGLRVEGCEPKAQTDCGPFTKSYEIGFGATPPASLEITGYTLFGQNGTSRNVVLSVPLVIY